MLALRGAPNWRAVFGADFHEYGHRFELRPVLTEEQVAAMERRRGVTFPAEYRSFLLEVGAGGAGPDYGLFPVDPVTPVTPVAPAAVELVDAAAAPAPDAATPDAATPTPKPPAVPLFRPERTREWEEHQSAEPQRAVYGDTVDDEERFRRDYAAWDARDDELLDALTDGTLYLSEQGCGYYTLMALTGPERGTMWHDARAAAEGVIPVEFIGSTGRVTFAQWYAHWLTHAERRAWDEPTT
ncbi:SMI1/KNR4 family protein [Streptomyces sp. NPDC059002]|uniref:SMI1/KNR4 family protein n=1 Tax=Streptomyces sp. NPDC059002 TaxID=3346690 RepID=UPI003696DCCE